MEISDSLGIVKQHIIPILQNTDYIKNNRIEKLHLLDNFYILINLYKSQSATYKTTVDNTFKYPYMLNKSNSVYPPSTITKYILNEITHQKKISFNLNNRIINIIVSKTNNTKINKKLITNIIVLLKLFDKLSNTQLKPLNIFLYPTHFKKLLPKEKSKLISPINVNSGYTSFHTNIDEIVIFRGEELFKVFIHEAMHYYNFDIKKTKPFETSTIFVKNCSKLYGETYTEIWARILNIMFIAIDKTKYYNDYLQFFKLSLYIESIFSYFQALKILNYNNLNYNSLINNITSIENYNENSNAYCYYILTSLLLLNIDETLIFCSNNNNIRIKFDILESNHDNFINILNKILHSDRFKKIITILSNYKLNNNTLRMTIIE
jgi:hypothetical protein